MMRQTPPRVLLALGWYDYRLHRGIEQYAQEHRWHLCADVTREKIIPWGWDGDGILAWLGAGDDLAEFVRTARKPTVDFSFRRPELKFPRVLVDHAAVARLAAEHFLARGFQHFAYYSDADNWAFEETGRGFVAALEAAGRPCVWLRWHRSPDFTAGRLQWQRKRRWLAAALKSLPQPLAVFTANDPHALEVLESCERAGLPVPEAVSLIGVDNSLLAVEAMDTPISSVDTNLEMVGYRGAACLDRLMSGQFLPPQPVRIPPRALISRRSSDAWAVNHPGVARCLKFIRENFARPIGVEDLASAAGMSRRGLHDAFLQHIGWGPGEELHRVRIHRARELLANPEHKVEFIAGQCGFHNTNSFGVAFKKAVGLAPKQYRALVCHRA